MGVVDGVGKEKKACPSHGELRRREVEWVVGVVRIIRSPGIVVQKGWRRETSPGLGMDGLELDHASFLA